MKARDERNQKRKSEEKVREENVRGKSQTGEDAAARKGRKVTKQFVFPMFCGSGGSKIMLAKAACAEPAGQMRDTRTAHPCCAKDI